MLRITQGHEKSISLEVFLKSFLLLSESERQKVVLYASKQSIISTCKLLKLKVVINQNEIVIENCKLNCSILQDLNKTQTTMALEAAIRDIDKKDTLVTMPSSKDQIFYNNKICSGHTDYFRKRFKDSNISMVFNNKWENILLLTDHIPLKEVSNSISKELIINKVTSTLKYYTGEISTVAFAGINPHAGENGLLGNEDNIIKEAIKELKKENINVKFIGPLAGDSLHTLENRKLLKVYAYHDQGLSYFKGKYNFIGINTTIGLPFKRVSVDHGTAFELYGKNTANYMGCYSLLKRMLKEECNEHK